MDTGTFGLDTHKTQVSPLDLACGFAHVRRIQLERYRTTTVVTSSRGRNAYNAKDADMSSSDAGTFIGARMPEGRPTRRSRQNMPRCRDGGTNSVVRMVVVVVDNMIIY